MTASMQTEELLWSSRTALMRSAEVVRQGAPVVIPTETVYGLTADAENEAAVEQVFALKQRPLDKPSAIFLAHAGDIDRYARDVSPLARKIIEEFLPGPLTVVLNSKRADWPGVVSAERKIGIRISLDEFVRDLVKQCSVPLLATSAGVSGSGDLKSLTEIRAAYANKLPLIVYKDEVSKAGASTVVDLSGPQPRILRQGGLKLPPWCFSGEEN